MLGDSRNINSSHGLLAHYPIFNQWRVHLYLQSWKRWCPWCVESITVNSINRVRPRSTTQAIGLPQTGLFSLAQVGAYKAILIKCPFELVIAEGHITGCI